MNNNQSLWQKYFDFSQVDWPKVGEATRDTVYLTLVATFIIFFVGMLLGILLYALGHSKKAWGKVGYGIVSVITNVLRAVPFMILLIFLMPVTKTLMGTTIGVKAAYPALILSASPFFARLVELALREVDGGVLEAADALGASPLQIFFKVLIPESLPALISGLTVTTVSMIGFTAMAGVIGAGGLGQLAWNTGFQRSNYTVILVATVMITLFVFLVQGIGDFIVKKVDKR
ncbi:methionine ABC transporter permease [Enterococcus nangangensis]|uniref:methionine ABC transporter permease n=1 Tax=Enterococcus nangangensis TaxID=2559926 RepID=UPI0010F61CC4|nr:methionine ABC transporter permease [Enterococcus nangangensis]